VDQGHGHTVVVDGVADRHADQALAALLGHGLDADARRIRETDAARLELRLQEVDEALDLLRPGRVLDAGVDVLGVLTEHDHVGERGVLHRRRDAGEVADRTDAGVEVQRLAHHDVQRADAAADRGAERTFDGHHELAQRLQRLVGEPGPADAVRLLAGVDLHPLDAALAAVGALDRGVDHLAHHRGDVDADAVALDERDDGPLRHLEAAVGVDGDAGALLGHPDVFVLHARPATCAGTAQAVDFT